MEFRPDGTLMELAIGRGDAPEARPAGRWEADGSLIPGPADGSAMAGSSAGTSGSDANGPGGRAGRIVSTTADRLEIEWKN